MAKKKDPILRPRQASTIGFLSIRHYINRVWISISAVAVWLRESVLCRLLLVCLFCSMSHPQVFPLLKLFYLQPVMFYVDPANLAENTQKNKTFGQTLCSSIANKIVSRMVLVAAVLALAAAASSVYQSRDLRQLGAARRASSLSPLVQVAVSKVASPVQHALF